MHVSTDLLEIIWSRIFATCDQHVIPSSYDKTELVTQEHYLNGFPNLNNIFSKIALKKLRCTFIHLMQQSLEK